MPRLIELPALPEPTDSTLIEFGMDRTEVARLWRCLLAMAVRDEFTSLHWHPWLERWALHFTARGRHECMVRPPVELDGLVSDAARELIVPGRIRSAVGRWLGRSCAARFDCASEYGRTEWSGVWWRTGRHTGADFYRLELPVEPVVEQHLSPSPAVNEGQ